MYQNQLKNKINYNTKDLLKNHIKNNRPKKPIFRRKRLFADKKKALTLLEPYLRSDYGVVNVVKYNITKYGHNFRIIPDFVKHKIVKQTENFISNEIVQHNRRAEHQQDIAFIEKSSTYRGNRHNKCLPVRGQRTKTNAKTNRKKKKIKTK